MTCHVNDIGTTITLTITESDVAVNLSTTSAKQIEIYKPNGEILVVDADFTTNGTDGKIKYIIVAGDFNQPGTYTVKGHVEFASGKWDSDAGTFEVED